ncbi:unnamed protein product, partial [Ectocarpus sp. 4 AP-2014]
DDAEAPGARLSPQGKDVDEGPLLRPLMLSYTIPEEQQHRRVRVRLEGSPWSSPFALDQGGSNHVLEVSGRPRESATVAAAAEAAAPAGLVSKQKQKQKQKQKHQQHAPKLDQVQEQGLGWGAARRRRRREDAARQAFAVGVSIKAAPAPFDRTKVVALAPRYVIVNATGRSIQVQQAGLPAGVEPLTVGSDGQAEFHWPQAGASSGWFGGTAAVGAKNRRMVLRFCGGSGDGEG